MNLDFLLKVLIIAGAIILFDKLLDKLAARDKLIRRIDTLGKQFSLFQTEANEAITKYDNSYNKLVEIHKDYKRNVENLLSQSSHMTEQIVQYAYEMIEDNDRLYKRLDLVEQFLSSENPSQEKQEELIQAIKEDIKLREEFEKRREEFLRSLHEQHELDEAPEIEMGDD